MYTSSLRSCRTTEYIVVMQEVLVKSQSWVETELSAQHFCQKQNFSNSDQNLNKNRYETFLYLASFVQYCYFNPGIVDHLYVICITKFSIAALKLVHFTVKLRPMAYLEPNRASRLELLALPIFAKKICDWILNALLQITSIFCPKS